MAALARPAGMGVLMLRLVTGWVFLEAGLHKVLGAEPFHAAGFLKFGTLGSAAGAAEGAIVNPTHALWVGLAENAAVMSVVDLMVPLGQVLIGIALILGLATRFAGAMAFLMMGLITIAAWDFANGIVNYTLFLALAGVILAVAKAGEVYGLDAVVLERPTVHRRPALRALLG